MVFTEMTLAKFTSLHFIADLDPRFRNLTSYDYTSLSTYAYLRDKNNAHAGETLKVRSIKAKSQQHHRDFPNVFAFPCFTNTLTCYSRQHAARSCALFPSLQSCLAWLSVPVKFNEYCKFGLLARHEECAQRLRGQETQTILGQSRAPTRSCGIFRTTSTIRLSGVPHLTMS